MADTPGVLRNLRIKRVALVDSGANFDKATGDGAHIMMYKRASKDPDPDPIQEETPVKKSFMQKLLGLFTETDVTKRAAMVAEIEKAFPPDDGDEDDKPIHKADDSMCKCADCVAKSATAKSVAKAAADAELAKGGAEVAKRIADIEKVNADLTKANNDLIAKVNAQIEKADKEEIRTVLKSFKKASIDVEKDVDVFYAMRKANQAGYDRAIALLKAADTQLEQSAMYRNLGSSRIGEGSAWAQLVAKSEALMSKSTAKLTKEAALDEVMQDPSNLGLVKAYRDEQASNQ